MKENNKKYFVGIKCLTCKEKITTEDETRCLEDFALEKGWHGVDIWGKGFHAGGFMCKKCTGRLIRKFVVTAKPKKNW